MSMQVFVLNEETARTAVESLLQQAAGNGLEIRNAEGNVIAYLLPPNNEEAWAYAEAGMEIDKHRDEIMAAMERRSGVTTTELLERAERAGKIHDLGQMIDVAVKLMTEARNELMEQAPDRKSSVRKAKAG